MRLRVALAALGIVAAGLVALDRAFPLPAAARDLGSVSGTVVVLAADGTLLRGWPGADGAMRHPVAIEAVSPLYLQALLQVEDRRFAMHPGVDPVALARAAWQWLRAGRVVSGGSTLTMQVARILDPPRGSSRTAHAKLRQILRALQLEAHLDKREILALYLNHAPMGGQVEGVEMAARSYLGKPASELGHGEAALLVALPQMPSRLRPDRAPQAAQQARDRVLARMQAVGAWRADDVADARMEKVFAPPLRARWLAPLAAERVRTQPAQQAGAEARGIDATSGTGPAAGRAQAPDPTAPGGRVVHTLIDAGVQATLERMLQDRLATLPPQASIAALVVDNRTLSVLGYAGSADFSDDARAAHVDMVRAVRSPGSTLKPFLYAMALDEGLVHSESLMIDAPQTFGGYAPGNFQAAFAGPVSVSEALQRSLNVPAVDLLERIGPVRFAARLRNAGLRLRMPAGAEPNLSLVLGGAGTTLEELVGAYTALARGGVAGRPRLVPDAPLVEARLMSAGAAFVVREILENGGRPDAPFRETSRRVAWKTGTSFGFRDAWAVGVTDRHTVGIWVGRPDGTPNPGHFGANTAAPIVQDLLAALGPSATLPRTVPPGVAATPICWPLGLAAAATPPEHCRVRRAAWTLEGTAPPTLPDRVRGGGLVETAWIDPRTGERLRPGCAPARGDAPRTTSFARWPALLEPWIDGRWRSEVEALGWAADCADGDPRRALRVTGLEAGSIARTAPGRGEVVLQLRAVGSADALTWLLDGVWVGTTPARSPTLRLTLATAGDHALTVMDAQGRYERVAFSVR
jgi:penicillin-binding protein 1C